MITALVIVWLLRGQEIPLAEVIPFDRYVTAQECRDVAGPALQRHHRRLEMLGWKCVEMPFTKAANL